MKLTKAKLQKIIKEEINAVSEAEQYMGKSSGEGRWRLAPDSYEMKLGLEVLEGMKSEFPALIKRLQIDDDILQQLTAEAVASAGYVSRGELLSPQKFFAYVNKFLQED